MDRKNKTWIGVGTLVVLAALVLIAFVFQPSPEDILIQTVETLKTFEDLHAVVEVSVTAPEQSGSATLEMWAKRGGEGEAHGAFRLEVLQTSFPEAAGVVAVSDGSTLWVYSPEKGDVLVGTVEEFKAQLEEGELPDFGGDFKYPDFEGDIEHPETTEEAVEMLLEYVTAKRDGTEDVAGQSAYVLNLVPIPEQMPPEFVGVGGMVNLWIGTESSVPLAVEYTGGTMGEVVATATLVEYNLGLLDDLFTFEVPEGVDVVNLSDLQPESLSLEEAAGSAEFELLSPSILPEGAALVDVLQTRGAIVQRYALADGGSFTVTQGTLGDAIPSPPVEGEEVEIRGTTGTLFVDEDGSRVLLAWSEGDLFFWIAGNLSADQATSLSESLE
jgi:outer membrane lipoprotein-sorting protein